jgi:hypothetical protein
VYDIEEIECQMSDIEEMNKSNRLASSRRNDVRGSVIHAPKDFPFINPSGISNTHCLGKVNESQSNLSSISY